jgi:hypothetical protein
MKAPNGDEDFKDAPMPMPPWMRARRSGARVEPHFANSPSAAVKAGDGKIHWPPPSAKLARSDSRVGMGEVRLLRSLEPDRVPEPPAWALRRRMAPASLAKFSLYVWLAAMVIYGIVEITLAYGDRPSTASSGKSVVAVAVPQPTLMSSATRSITMARLVIEDQQALTNEPLPLNIVLHGATGGEAVILTGLAEGTRLSAGEAVGGSGWRVPARALGDLVAYPPASFVGVMDAAVELRAADDALLDTQGAKLKWIAKSTEGSSIRAAQPEQSEPVLPRPSIVQLSPQRISNLVARGVEFLKDGNFAAARLMWRPAADAGHPEAALLLGATYDPVVLAELGVFGLRSDRSAARAWYERAVESGSTEASRRIERLAQTNR